MIRFFYNTDSKDREVISDSRSFRFGGYEVKAIEDIEIFDDKIKSVKLNDIDKLSKRGEISGELFISSKDINFIYDSYEYKINANSPFVICNEIKDKLMPYKDSIKRFEVKKKDIEHKETVKTNKGEKGDK